MFYGSDVPEADSGRGCGRRSVASVDGLDEVLGAAESVLLEQRVESGFAENDKAGRTGYHRIDPTPAQDLLAPVGEGEADGLLWIAPVEPRPDHRAD